MELQISTLRLETQKAVNIKNIFDFEISCVHLGTQIVI